MPTPHFQERPILVSPSLAAELGLEGATLLAVLSEFAFHQPARVRNGYHWFRLTANQAHTYMPFWAAEDIQRISQNLRARGQLLLASAPFQSSGELKFAFAQKRTTTDQPPTENNPAVAVSPIPANWTPSKEILARLAEHNIPSGFCRELVPEFVTYWRERGEAHRSWGSKFQALAVRRWRQFEQQRARDQQHNAQQKQLAADWSPDEQVLAQLSQEGIPLAHIQDCANRFKLYYRETGATVSSWTMTFYAWVKKDWEEKQTPFLANRKPVAMNSQWAPAEHTLDYLKQLEIDEQFIAECVPEFVHKWIENGSYRSNWGDLFSQHVSNQWAHFQQGITPNKVASLVSNQWQPSTECLELLLQQCEMPLEFIQAQIPEFVLYWRNRAEAKHSWDSVFIRHLKFVWAKQHQLSQDPTGKLAAPHERQQTGDRQRNTRDIPLAEQLNDHSWAY